MKRPRRFALAGPSQPHKGRVLWGCLVFGAPDVIKFYHALTTRPATGSTTVNGYSRGSGGFRVLSRLRSPGRLPYAGDFLGTSDELAGVSGPAMARVRRVITAPLKPLFGPHVPGNVKPRTRGFRDGGWWQCCYEAGRNEADRPRRPRASDTIYHPLKPLVPGR